MVEFPQVRQANIDFHAHSATGTGSQALCVSANGTGHSPGGCVTETSGP